MIGIYFGGTGNSKFCIEKFLSYYDKEADSISIEENGAVQRRWNWLCGKIVQEIWGGHYWRTSPENARLHWG